MERVFISCFLMFALFGCSHRKVLTLPAIEPPPPFDMKAFERTCTLADALARDDLAAWRSTDSIMAEKPLLLDSLDQTWFVDDRSGKRYVFYGRYSVNNDTFHPKYAFVTEEDGDLLKIPAVVDERVLQFARAVTTGKKHFQAIIDSMQLNVDYNHYIRKSDDGSYAMWFFPAGYGNYCAHGVDIYLTINPSGSLVTGHNIVGNYLRYFELDKKTQTVELDNTYDSMPSLGNVFFAIRNRERFDSIVILNGQSTSTMTYSPERKKWVWVHGRRE
ncbi:MAG: hypothetical protein JW913_20145 [Chitinispirillaceae bacterium]|nr:hypothetical protein [Chitinispirillaceae bacterium]